MECLKYYLDINKKETEFSFQIDQRTASEIIGFGGYNIKYIRKNYNVEVNIIGDKNDVFRTLEIRGKDKFKVYQKLMVHL